MLFKVYRIEVLKVEANDPIDALEKTVNEFGDHMGWKLSDQYKVEAVL